MRSIALPIVLTLVAACGPAEESTDLAQLAIDEEGSALSATRSGFKLELARTTTTGLRARLKGTVSHALTDVSGFLAEGEVLPGVGKTASKQLVMAFQAPDIERFVSGRPAFLSLGFLRDGGARTYVAKAELRAGLVRRTGTTELAPRAWFQTFRVGDRDVVRLRGNAPATVMSVSAKASGSTFQGVANGREWIVDVDAKVFATTVAYNRTVSITVKTGAGTLKAGFGAVLEVARLALGEGDPTRIWPAPTCTALLKACLAQSGPDTSTCGDAYAVSRCADGSPAVGPLTSEDVGGFLDAVLDDVAADYAPALAKIFGEARGEQAWEVAVSKARVAAEVVIGQAFASDEAAFNAVKAPVVVLLDTVLARPLQLVTASTPRANNVGAARQIALEAVLAELAGMDLTRTEYGRSLEELVRANRDRWATDLMNFRSGVATAEVQTVGSTYVVIGTILSAHVEVTVAKSSGRVTNVLYEID